MLRAFFLSLVCAAPIQSVDLAVDRAQTSATFDGLGAISGGGATSVLLKDYPEPSKSQILDYLFKPNFGASLQILKVEIGGDSQSTDGTESSHMHDADTVDLHTGYEWWLMQEAKARNPNIKIYGLAWAFPGWVGNHSGSPFDFPDLTSRYLVEWVSGAKREYGIDVDYLGVWNERSSDSTFVQTLRKALNAEGISGTKIVVKDGGSDICDDLANDKAYADSVDIIGLHYPTDFQDYSVCHDLGKPLWASEESSSYDDLNGAACWGRIVNSHWVLNGMTSSIMWNLVGSYYHGTSWYASSLMTAVEPWTGNYDVNPVIWATAHVTQFTEIGWKYLANGSGSGEMPYGGYYATWVDPDSNEFTMNIVKISRDHASCTRPKLPDLPVDDENVTFSLAQSMRADEELEVWYSNFETYEEQPPIFEHSTVKVVDGRFTLKVVTGAMYTITTRKTGHKGSFGTPPKSSPSFPLPYSDDFQTIASSQGAPLFSDQIGAFEAHTSSDGMKSLVQMVPELPIGWSDAGSNGPMTLIGMREFQDVMVNVSFKLPSGQPSQPQGDAANCACVAVRVDQMWANGVVLCVNAAGHWNLTNAGPALQGLGQASPPVVASGKSETSVGTDVWHSLSLMVQPSQNGQTDSADGFLNGELLFSAVPVRTQDTGFAAFGSNGWWPIEYRNFSLARSPRGWEKPTSCSSASIGILLSAQPCARNGLVADDQAFDLLPSYQMRHLTSGLCATADPDGSVTLQHCDSTKAAQLFVHEYTDIRNWPVAVKPASGKKLVGKLTGEVAVDDRGDWSMWSFFPNTRQLRNQYSASSPKNNTLGYPLCLSTCHTQTDVMI